MSTADAADLICVSVLSERLINLADLYEAAELSAVDKRMVFDPAYDRKVGFRMKQSLTAPLIMNDRYLFGVMQLAVRAAIDVSIPGRRRGGCARRQCKQIEVRVTGYGDRAIDFEVLICIDIRQIARRKARRDLYFTIFEMLKARGVEILYPQRDIHIRSGFDTRLPAPEA